ncbi:MAG: TonB family protein [Acidobacteriia bacterium]|nr:TonB family protein [Terriglobia bacterium]
MRTSIGIVACVLGVALSAQDAFSPARFRTGRLPDMPALAVGGGQVFVELGVNAGGRVTDVSPLRTTPPFTDLVVGAVREWRFVPAVDEIASTPAGSKVLVAAVFRAPALNAPTLGEAPKDIASASAETAFPLATTVPAYSPLARGSGVVLLELRVDPDGTVSDVTVIRSAPPFDDAAKAAARLWRFRPARIKGTPVATLAYVVFGFPVPVGVEPPRAGR